MRWWLSTRNAETKERVEQNMCGTFGFVQFFCSFVLFVCFVFKQKGMGSIFFFFFFFFQE